MSTLTHITLDSGHERESDRSEITDFTMEAVA